MSAAKLITRLTLQPHPEGGWYREIYRSPTRVETPQGGRSALTAIYYLLERGQLSRWHVVRADELWHFYGGAPLELFEYDPTLRRLARHVLGPVATVGADDGVDAAAGSGRSAAEGALGAAVGAGTAAAAVGPARETISVAVIPTGIWQAARSLGAYSLVGCTVGPGFDFADFQFVSDLTSRADHFRGELAPLVSLL